MGKCVKIETPEAFWQQAETMKGGVVFAMLTDEIVCESWPLPSEEKTGFREKEKKLLDIRIFNEGKELRMFRGNIGREFLGRMREDDGESMDEAECFDEEQYLDIDTVQSEKLFSGEGKVKATGGGCYRLPLSGYKEVKVKIRNYLGYYEETGQAYVKDWRLVKLFQEER